MLAAVIAVVAVLVLVTILGAIAEARDRAAGKRGSCCPRTREGTVWHLYRLASAGDLR
jgi:hypothetical protein